MESEDNAHESEAQNQRHDNRTETKQQGVIVAALADAVVENGVDEEEPIIAAPDTEAKAEAKTAAFNETMSEEVLALYNTGAAGLLAMKEHALRELETETQLLATNEELEDAEREMHVKLLELRRQHLLLAESFMSSALTSLRHVIEADVASVKAGGLAHVRELQDTVLHVSETYKDLLASVGAYAAQDAADTATEQHEEEAGMVKDALEKVSNAADDVESKLKQETFKEAHNSGAVLDTVVVIDAETVGEAPGQDTSPSDEGKQPLHLVDTNNDEFVLTKSHDATAHFEDHNLLSDLVLMICASFICGALFHTLRMPAFFGFVCAGIVLGPVGANRVHSMVQLETLAQFGIFFILFVLGLEFNLQKLSTTFRVSVWGSLIMLVVDVALVAILATAAAQSVTASVMTALCTSLASTAVVLKLLSNDETESAYGRTMIGILVMQDLYFGLMITMLPMLGANATRLDALWQLLTLAQGLAVYAVVCFAIANYFMPLFLAAVNGLKSAELRLFAVLFACFASLKATEAIGLSPELGCFTAGVLISSVHKSPHDIVALVEPIKDLFAALFFAAIGLHVYPSFVWAQWRLLMLMTLGVVAIKFWVGFFVLHKVFGQSAGLASLSALGLSQISEFAFVMSSRAKSTKVISREVYYLLLGTTTLSLVIVPLLFGALRLVLLRKMHLHVHKHEV